MKSLRTVVFVALAVAILYGVAHFAVPKRQPARETASKSSRTDREAASAQPRRPVRPAEPRVTFPTIRQRQLPQENVTSSASAPQAEPVKTASQTGASAQKITQADGNTQSAPQNNQVTRAPTEPMQDPMARLALGFVGADPDAELYWYTAINNPSLSAQERQDLIEDLNEDGLSDPQHPAPEDLPLILNRIQLIEAVGGDAMDEVNADAFVEAYKDLVDLAVLAMAG